MHLGFPHSWHSSALAKRQSGVATRRGPRHANDGQIHAINVAERYLWGAVIIILYTDISDTPDQRRETHSVHNRQMARVLAHTGGYWLGIG